MLSDIRNYPYRKTTKLYDVTVTSSKVLQPPNFSQTLPRYSLEAMPSFTFVTYQALEIGISQNVKGGNFMPPSGSWVNVGIGRHILEDNPAHNSRPVR